MMAVLGAASSPRTENLPPGLIINAMGALKPWSDRNFWCCHACWPWR